MAPRPVDAVGRLWYNAVRNIQERRKWSVLQSVFDPDNWFFRPLGKLVDIVMLSLFWLTASMVLLPFGGATTALYDSAVRCLRREEQGPYARFVRTLKENFAAGGIAGAVALAVCYGLYRLHGLLYLRADTGSREWGVLYIAFWVLLAAVNGVLAYLFPLLSRFEFKAGGLLATGFRLAMGHLPSTLLLGLWTTFCIIIVSTMWLTALFIPCLWALGASLPLERIFRPYVEAQTPKK